MKSIYYFTCSLMILFSSVSFAETSTCVDKAQVKDVMKDFDFYGSAQWDLCNDKNRLTQVSKALILLKGLKLQNATGPFSQNILKEQPYDFFKKRVSKIVFEASCDDSTTTAYVIHEQKQIIHICPREQEVIDTAATLVHEARHLDGYRHVDCKRGLYSLQPGNGACDSSYELKGSYAINVDFYLKVASTSSVSPALRQFAKSNTLYYLTERFNALPGDLKDGLFLTNMDNQVSFFDGTSNPAIKTLKTGAIQFLNGNAHPDIADQPKGIDLATTENYGCLLGSVKMVCYSLRDTSDTFTLNWKQIRPLSIYAVSTDRGHLQMTITDKQDRIADLPQDFEDLKRMRESDFNLKPNRAKILKIQQRRPYTFGGAYEVALKQDGKVFLKEGAGLTPVLTDQRFKNIVGPVVWSPTLEAL